MIQVTVGQKRTELVFDRPAYAGDPSVGYEPDVINICEKFLEPGDIAVDAGASIGFHTCLMSKLVGPTGLVLAFEPQEESFKLLQKHVYAVNQLNNVGCVKAALWKEPNEHLMLWNVEDLGYSSFHRYASAVSSEEVEGVTLDFALEGVGHPRLIKIDCEGTEPEVVLGALNVLERGVDAVIMELNFHLFEQTGRSEMELRKAMVSMGYDMFFINVANKQGGFLPPYLVHKDLHLKLQGGHHINVLFSTEEKVKARWMNA